MRDLFEARLMFEPQLAALACRRAADEEISEIIAAGKAVERHIRSNEDRSTADQEFHKKIAIASHNRFMLQLLPIIYSTVSEALLLNEQQELLSEYMLQDHAQLMFFLEHHDADGAKAAMSVHLRNAVNILGITC